MADLQRILRLLDEQHLALQVGLHHDTAREMYRMPRMSVETFEQFQEEIAKYYEHHFRLTVSNTADLPEDWAFGFAWKIVEQAYGSVGGMEGAYRAAKTGIQGGLAGVFNAIAAALKREHEERYISHVLRREVDPLEFDEVVDLMQQYLSRFGRFIQDEYKKKPEELAADWEKLIILHTKVLSSMRASMGRV